MNGLTDNHFMARALQLAKKGIYTTAPNPCVGCVLVRDGRIIGEGWHQRAGNAHAEVNAIADAGGDTQGATAYVTLEPCCHQGRTGPCTQALIQAGVSKVVVSMLDPNPLVAGQGMQQLQAAGITTQSGLMREQAEQLNKAYIRRIQGGLPWLTCKMAMSLDGRTAMASGESRWITHEPARRHVHRLRARHQAILTGIGTVLQDDPAMDVRLTDEPPAGGWLQPLRVVLDSKLRMPVTARMLQTGADVWVVTLVNDPVRQRQLETAGARVIVLASESNSVDLHAVMQMLADEGINAVMLESGADLSGALLQAGLIDELYVYMAAHVMGHQARALFNLPGVDSMQQRIEFKIRHIQAVGPDWCIEAVPCQTDDA